MLHGRSRSLKSGDAKRSELTEMAPAGSLEFVSGNTQHIEKIRRNNLIVCLVVATVLDFQYQYQFLYEPLKVWSIEGLRTLFYTG